jgi:polar amino acid transport system substrate-binding protein
MDDTKRLLIKALPLVGVTAALAASAPRQASAQQATDGSTYDEILKRGTLRLGVVNTEPWTFKDPTNAEGGPPSIAGNGVTWRGVGVAVAKIIGDALGVRVEPVETGWGTAVAGLQANQFDIMFALDGTPVRGIAAGTQRPRLAYAAGILRLREHLDH